MRGGSNRVRKLLLSLRGSLDDDVGAVLHRLRYLLIALSGLGLILLLLWAVVVVPPLLIDTSGIADPVKRLDEVNALRTTLVAVLGGLAVAAGTAVAALTFRETSRQNRLMLELQRRGQVTERFTRAIEQLGQRGDDKLDVRIGAAYALEQIAQDSAELHWPIMEVLTAYLREHASVSLDRPAAAQPAPAATSPPNDSALDPPKKRPADLQAIATVIGRRRADRDPAGQPLNLFGVSLPGVTWARANLKGATLFVADLVGANLVEAQLEGARLSMAQLAAACLDGARLDGAYLTGANLVAAHLKGAHLEGAHLEGASLAGAHLEGASLAGAHLEGAHLAGAHLAGAHLAGAHLEGTHLEGAHLGGTHDLPPELTSRLEGVAEAGDPSKSTDGG